MALFAVFLFVCLQRRQSESECIYSSLCVLPPYQGSYDVFLIDFGKLITSSAVTETLHVHLYFPYS